MGDKADAFFGFAEKEVYTMNVKDELSRESNADNSLAHHFGSLSCEWVGNGKFRSQEHASWDRDNFEAESFEEVAAHHADGVDPVWGRFAETKICLNKTDIVIPLAIPNDHGVVNAYNVKTGIDEPGAANDGDADVKAADFNQQKESDVILNHPPLVSTCTPSRTCTRERLWPRRKKCMPATTSMLTQRGSCLTCGEMSSNWTSPPTGAPARSSYRTRPVKWPLLLL